MVTATSTLSSPPPPPRFTGDPKTDSVALSQWVYSFYQSTIAQGYFITSQTVENGDLTVDGTLTHGTGAVVTYDDGSELDINGIVNFGATSVTHFLTDSSLTIDPGATFVISGPTSITSVLTYSAGSSSVIAGTTEFTSGSVTTFDAGSTVNFNGTVTGAGSVTRVARTSNTLLGSSDRTKLIDITSGTFSQTFDTAATLGSGWSIFIRNSGTGDITLDPNGVETIDGLTSFIMYPGEMRLITCNGTALFSSVLHPFNLHKAASFTFTKPPGYLAFDVVCAAGSGGAGSGRRGAAGTVRTGGGGSGAGGITRRRVAALEVGATETCTVAAQVNGGAAVTLNDTDGNNGTAGQDTTFGSLVKAKGGAAGAKGTNGAVVAAIGGTGEISGGTGGDINAAGTTATSGTQFDNIFSATGGAAGGSLSAGDVVQDGGTAASAGAYVYAASLPGGSGGVAGANGGLGSGTGSADSGILGGSGGGGGGASKVANAGTGGVGGYPAGGSGGGGASLNGFNSGAGGVGQGGIMRITGVA